MKSYYPSLTGWVYPYEVILPTKEEKMKNMTADKVLRKTFEHLDAVLDEKSRQLEKGSENSETIDFSTKNNKQRTKKSKR